jgi:hypothetical protein
MEFLNTLNTPPCVAGHCDWRIPNVRELQSVVDSCRWGRGHAIWQRCEAAGDGLLPYPCVRLGCGGSGAVT